MSDTLPGGGENGRLIPKGNHTQTRLTGAKAMQLTINLRYDQIFELVRQLSPGEKERLFRDSEFPVAVQKPPQQTVSNEGTFDKESRLAQWKVDQCRQEALRLALECPVATPEEIENQNKFRALFRCRPT